MTRQARGESLWQRAERLLAQGQPDAARTALERLLAEEPGHALARLRLAMLATSAGRYRDSLAQLLEVAALRPAEPELALLVAGMLHRLGEVAAALACLSSPAMLAAAQRSELAAMARLAQSMEQPALALELLERADAGIAAGPNSQYLRATIATFAGRIDDAEAALSACLGQAPAHAPAHWSLARLRRQTRESNHTARLRALLARTTEPASEAYLGFALFKEFDDLGDTDAAWEALSRGCAAKRRQLAYSATDEATAFAVLETTGDAPEAGDRATMLADAPTPIFIVGLPRTGTTLLERILGGSGQVANAGELDDLPLQLRWLADRFSKSYLDAGVFEAAARADLAQLGQRYLEHSAWRARGTPFFTDKLPLNFLHVGFIARALPQARILHLVREPMDTCFSNLKELFAEAYPYSYVIDELAGHYGRYRRLMSHWHARYPGAILDVGYEDLVTAPEATARAVFAHCGLEWDPASLELGRAGGVVSTASTVQVREGIHARRVGGWRAYARQLEPLRQRLVADGWLPA